MAPVIVAILCAALPYSPNRMAYDLEVGLSVGWFALVVIGAWRVRLPAQTRQWIGGPHQPTANDTALREDSPWPWLSGARCYSSAYSHSFW